MPIRIERIIITIISSISVNPSAPPRPRSESRGSRRNFQDLFIPLLLRSLSTSLSTWSHPARFPSISNTRRKHCSRPSSSNPDHPAPSANPTPPARSSDPREPAARTGCSSGRAAAAQRHALYQRVQIRRVALAAHFHANLLLIRQVLVLVDRVAHLAQVVAQFLFAFADHREFRDRQRHRGKHQQNRAGDNQLQQRHAGFGSGSNLAWHQNVSEPSLVRRPTAHAALLRW